MTQATAKAQSSVTAGEPGLRLRDVCKSFGSVAALQPTSFDVPAGTLCSLLGPSGCGKTTTLRIVAGFELPDAGQVLIRGEDRTYDPPQRRKLGMVFQNYSLFPHMTVAQNVAFGLRMARVNRAETEARTRRMLDIVHLPQHADRYPHQLSGGQQQRVALARSLVTEPSMLLLDEPLGALDKNLREQMQFEIRQLQREIGITTLLVTHDQEEALTMSDMIVVMDRGRILQTGSPAEVYEHPRTRFVSEFLGTSNIIACTVAGAEEGGLRLRLPGDEGSSGFFVADVPVRPVGSTVLVAIRPEHLRIVPAGEAGPSEPRATVSGHVFRGATHVFQLQRPGLDRPLMAYRQITGPVGETALPVGAEVGLSWLPGTARLLEDEPLREDAA
ncbi:putative spermidine/putrescine transport system ATP-binding protein [Bosea lupini]|uniref:Spermidine/putrescine import ATP-binding protein PotA n=1 Tax=Bosea lupini TaxID=1036779 RepID=A0A1H7UHA2_9HYPH|nr:ABC transporter ATP-binding protein [Bosea lupini]SEL96341.1 putative spermidine/putrescine transport system ATP-binding protein [Bosea lupini]